jgi:hypothetical protein
VYHRSDIHFWKAGRIGPLIVESDCVLGHEAAGIVLKVGEGVEDFVVGELLCFSFPPVILSYLVCLDPRFSVFFLFSSVFLGGEDGLESAIHCVQILKRERARAGGYEREGKSRVLEKKTGRNEQENENETEITDTQNR